MAAKKSFLFLSLILFITSICSPAVLFGIFVDWKKLLNLEYVFLGGRR